MLFRKVDGWRRAGFASFEHYCSERFGMAVRAVEQRAALERSTLDLDWTRGIRLPGRDRVSAIAPSAVRCGCAASSEAERTCRSETITRMAALGGEATVFTRAFILAFFFSPLPVHEGDAGRGRQIVAQSCARSRDRGGTFRPANP